MATVCVFGAGAVGGHLAVRLAVAGHRVEVVARGAQLAAIRSHGLRLLVDGRELHASVHATDDVDHLSDPDAVIVTLKSTALEAAAASLSRLAQRTPVMAFALNGIPWWYGWEHAPPLSPQTSACLDPAGLARTIRPEAVVGVVVYSPNTVVAPGVISCALASSRFLIGPAVEAGQPAADIALRLLSDPAIGGEPTRGIRHELWRKLAFNVAISPVCSLTASGNRVVGTDPELHRLCRNLLAEVSAVASREGIALPVDSISLDPAKLSPHKPSMLQDLEAGRPLETDSILRAVQWLAREAGVTTPFLDTVTALVAGRARARD